jgi:hypothetical protein
MVILVRNWVLDMITDKDNVNKLFQMVESDTHKTIQDLRENEKSGLEINVYSYLRHLYDQHMFLMRLIDALMVDAIENIETIKQLAEFIKSPKENESTIVNITQRLEQREQEAKKFQNEHGKNLEWIRKFFEKESKTTME